MTVGSRCDDLFRWDEMMNATGLIKLMNRVPFLPLEVSLNDGSAITVNEPFELAAQRTSPCFIVYSGDRIDVVSYRNVSKIKKRVAAD